MYHLRPKSQQTRIQTAEAIPDRPLEIVEELAKSDLVEGQVDRIKAGRH